MTNEPRQTRDSDAMRRRILDATATVLARDGFGGFGVNAVAREAGCDKVLVYRYFGGVEGLLAALGSDLGRWIEAPKAYQAGDYRALVQQALHQYLATLRQQNLVKAILTWELAEQSERTAALGQAKSDAIARWFAGVRAAAGPAPEGVDAPAINAVLLAAIHHLALREPTGSFVGIDLTKPQSWARLEAAIALLADMAYGEKTRD